MVEQSNLVDHARRELELLGEDPETIAGYLEVIRAFASMGHSGSSASIAVPVINELLQYHPLSPITDDPDEWIHHGEDVWGEPGGIWQNSRDSRAFSKDHGVTYTLVEEDVGDGATPIHQSKNKKEPDG